MKKEKTIGYFIDCRCNRRIYALHHFNNYFRVPGYFTPGSWHSADRNSMMGEAQLIFTWWAFALLGLPLLIAYILIGQKFEGIGFIRWVTTFGVISGIVQIIGLLRWVFVIPVIANTYISTRRCNKRSRHRFFSNHTPIRRCFARGAYWPVIYNYLDDHDFICLY